MAQKRYDNYDYEEAYSRTLKIQEEWEWEQLARTGEKGCLYRTTTTRTLNRRYGYEMVEAQIYPSFLNRKDVPRTKRCRESKPSQRNLNRKNSRRHLLRLITANFGPDDIWATWTWNDDTLPENEAGAKKDLRNFFRRVNRKRAKMGLPNARYIYVLAYDGYVRPHAHIVMSGDGLGRDELENMWGKCDRPNTRRISPSSEDWLAGLATYISANPHGTKSWCASRNLDKPEEPTRSYSRFSRRTVEKMVKDNDDLVREMEKAYPGYHCTHHEEYYDGITAAYYIYARMEKKYSVGDRARAGTAT